jgi:hypothetical protein
MSSLLECLLTPQQKAAAKAADAAMAIIDAHRPREPQGARFKREARAYAESVTRGLPCTHNEFANVARRREVELLTEALADSQQNLSEALGLLESEAKEIWTVGKPETQNVFEGIWQSEQPALYRQWVALGSTLGRGQ